jgi:peptidoglycan/xylan/chitin deacetylase (PgdA/CDA1 family)
MAERAPSLVITVDTEPDDQWAPPLPDGTLPPFAFANTRGIGRLAQFLRARGVPVTWMTSYSVVRDEESVRALRDAAAHGDEIAGHLHGWETPPYLEVDRTHRSFIGEYEPAVRFAKHRALLDAHEDAFGARPVSYRAGRWGVDELELRHLAELGYRIDSSIPPGIDFRDRYGLRAPGPDFRRWTAGAPNPFRSGPLWEVPASIVPIGALGGGAPAVALARAAGRRAPGSSASRALSAALARTRLQKLIWIRPLKHPRDELVRATRALLRRGGTMVNVMFHSSEAFEGTSPLSRTAADVDRLYGDLDAIVTTAREHGAIPRTLAAAVDALA